MRRAVLNELAVDAYGAADPAGPFVPPIYENCLGTWLERVLSVSQNEGRISPIIWRENSTICAIDEDPRRDGTLNLLL